ncbi:MAG: ABC transporter permease [Pirellulaceae bacterium]|nr:ABC transporter permease [Pirellulaceae bacterium]
MTAYANIYYLSEIADEPFACNSLQLLVEGGIAPSETFLRSLKELPRVESVSTRSRTADRAKRFFFMNQLISIGVMIGFAGTIFFASVLNSGLVNLAERQREVATFIAFGYSPWEIGNTFLRENMTLHLAGTLAGLPLGILLSSMAINAVNNDLLRLPLVISWSSFVGTFLVSILFAIVAHLVVQRHIHRMNCLEALNVKE